MPDFCCVLSAKTKISSCLVIVPIDFVENVHHDVIGGGGQDSGIVLVGIVRQQRDLVVIKAAQAAIASAPIPVVNDGRGSVAMATTGRNLVEILQQGWGHG